MPRKRATARKASVPIRDEMSRLRLKVKHLDAGMNELRTATEDLRRGHDMSLRRFGEIQLELDALKKISGR